MVTCALLVAVSCALPISDFDVDSQIRQGANGPWILPLEKKEGRRALENFSDGQPALLRRSGAACGIRKQTT
jgi:hypothetical protein